MVMGRVGTGNLPAEIEDSFSDEQLHVPIELPLLIHTVHLKPLSHELRNHENAHRCTKRDLRYGCHVCPNS